MSFYSLIALVDPIDLSFLIYLKLLQPFYFKCSNYLSRQLFEEALHMFPLYYIDPEIPPYYHFTNS